MNTPDPIPPPPKDFGVKSVIWGAGWLLWSNAITILTTLQLILLYLQGNDEAVMSRATFHAIVAANGILTIVLAQIKRAHPAKGN